MPSFSSKPKLIFIPHYLGSLKYFEKLTPYLKEKYEVSFLFMPHLREQTIEVMQAYCQTKNYHFYSMEKGRRPKILKVVPFLNPLLMFLKFKGQVKKLLKNQKIKKIVSVFDSSFYYYLLKKANQKGVKTFVLQWALSGELDVLGKTKKNKIVQELSNQTKKPVKREYSLKILYSKLANVFLSFLCSSFKNPQIVGKGSSRKFGVINQQAYDLFKKAGVSPNKMSVVGYLDFALSKKVQKNFSSPQAKNKLALKYKIDLNKKNIVVYSSSFNAKDVKVFTNQEQLNYFEEIVRTIRDVFPKEKTDILFKIHPSEEFSFYQTLEKYAVKLYGRETVNEELIFLSDLYIAHYSTTNLIAMIMQKECIFLNLLGARVVEETKDFFNIKKYLTEKEEFKKLLTDFSKGSLQKQYRCSKEMFTENSLQKILNWID